MLAFTASAPTVRPTISDERFVADANAVCRPFQDRLASTSTIGQDASDGDRSGAIEAVVAELERMVGVLATLELEVDDRAEVEAWLADWDAVLTSGRRTADALAAGDRDAADRAADAGQRPARAVNAFASANGLGACATRFG